jgi:transcriptional regulator with XRE-family HTH domain
MPSDNDERAFNQALCERVKNCRVQKNWTADQMARALGIPAERYRKYEGRSVLPVYLIERFALITGKSVEFIVTGHESKR